MTQPLISEDSPGSTLFPEYATLLDLISREVQGLSDEQLDWESDRWEWSKWSIRRQLSHMSALTYSWLLRRWGDTLFPDGGHGVDDITALVEMMDRYWGQAAANSPAYPELPTILEALRGGIDLAQRVLAERSVGFLRSHTLVRTGDRGPQQVLMGKAHPTGVTRTDERSFTVTLEWTMRHIYFEETTHLYNIQRLKRAQGLSTVVEVPRVGYWVVDGWDRSEP